MARQALLITLVLVFAAAASSQAFRRLETGDVVANFILVDFQGNIVRLDHSMGRKGTVVVFWAAWNPRSADALADLQELYEAHGPVDLRVVAVNVEHETWEPGEYDKVAAYVERSGVTFSVVVDMDLTLFDRYGVTVLPSMVLTDPSGKVVEQLAGYPPSLKEQFAGGVRQFLGESESKVAAKPEG